MIGGRGTGKGGGGGSKYGLYSGQVQSRVVDALRNHKKTRAAALNVKVRIWLDATGRVTRATVSGTSGKPDVDAAIRDEILTGLQLQNPPPEGMPMPIVMRLSATRPN
jgi:TonB family protein